MASLCNSLDSSIAQASIVCLNQDSAHPVQNCFIDDESYLQSDADQQLLLHIPFVAPVQISGISFTSVGEEDVPANVKLFINRPDFGFSDCETEKPAQELNLSLEDLSNSTSIPLRVTLFRSVHTLTIFIEENHGAEITKIQRILLVGIPSRPLDAQCDLRSSQKSRKQKVDAIVSAEVASHLGSLGSEAEIAQVLQNVAAVGDSRSRDGVRAVVGVYLQSCGNEVSIRRQALLLLGACHHLVVRCEGRGSKAINKARQIAYQGIMAALEQSVHVATWTLADIINRAPHRAALQLLSAMPKPIIIGEKELLRKFLCDGMMVKEIKPAEAVLIGEWIADGLQSELTSNDFIELARDFGSHVLKRITEDEKWCFVAARALSWLPLELQSDGLACSAMRAPAQEREKHVVQDWSVDLESLPAYKLCDQTTVVIIDTLDGIEHLENNVAEVSAIGVDTEFGRDKGSLALIQIAFGKTCYLVDTRPSLGNTFHQRLQFTLEIVFDRVVFGWSFKEDSRRLTLLHENLRSKLRDVKDLQPLARQRLGLWQPPSLQRACAELLEVAVDKGEQRSDWERRPLTESQKMYAACDATILFWLAHALGEEHGIAETHLAVHDST